MQRLTFFTVLTVFFLSCSLFEEDGATERQPPREPTPNERAIVHAGNVFGMNVFNALHEADPASNMLISPLSISMALGMTLNGAANETYDAMRQTLALTGLEEEDINSSYQTAIELLTSMDPEVIISIANSIWYRDGLPVYDEFIETNQTYFNAEVAELDFTDPNSVDVINDWVDTATNGIIETILQEIPDEMVMYLINALYFKGGWRIPFDEEDTQDRPFHNYDGTETSVPMMGHEIIVPYYASWEENLYIADIPFGDSLFSFTVIIPEDVKTFADSLTLDKWNHYIDNLHSGEVYIGLPRFDLAWEKSLNDILKILGMDIAFDEYAADFSRIMPLDYGNLFISEVKHKTYLTVDEEGAVAAAVTSVGLGLTSMPPAIIADRPFILAIRENH
ncbi:MAG: serpin family protein, partial [Candidatus Marinimicrobia bacterium]|nr:serpin family protein [Candidatus Neomarinimicrobiota bacterium]